MQERLRDVGTLAHPANDKTVTVSMHMLASQSRGLCWSLMEQERRRPDFNILDFTGCFGGKGVTNTACPGTASVHARAHPRSPFWPAKTISASPPCVVV